MFKKLFKNTKTQSASVDSAAQDETLYDNAVFAWIAPEYLQHQKGERWYLFAGIVAALFIFVAILQGNWTMALAIIAFGAVYYYIQNYHPPKEIEIKISEMGIKVGHKTYPFSHIKAFWFHYNPPFIKTLNIRVDKGHYFADLSIQLNNQDPVQLRQFLCSQISEWEGKDESFLDILLRLLRL